MKAKTFVVLLIVCGILGLLAFQTNAPKKTARVEGKDTGPLLPDLPVNDVADISIRHTGGAVRLVKGGDIWQVESRYGYPADFDKIADFVRKLKDLKIGRSFAATDDILVRQALHMPDQQAVPDDQKAVQVVLKNGSGKELADLLVGKGRENGGGHYVMPASSKTVYLVDKSLNRIETDASGWLDQDLVNVSADAVASVRCIAPDGQTTYLLKRPEKGQDPVFESLPEGKTAPPSKLTPVFAALSSLKIEDVADPALPKGQTGLGQAPCLEYALFDGTVYQVCVGKTLTDDADAAEGYVKLAVRFDPPPAPETEASSTEKPSVETGAGDKNDDTAKAEKTDPARLAEAAESLNAKIGAWVYVLPKWKMDRLVTDPDALFEAPESAASSQ